MVVRVIVGFLGWCLVIPVALAEDPVYFADATLKEAVESDLWISDPTPTDMLGLTSLSCVQDRENRENGIKSLTGLEYALNLRSLNLRSNQISNLSPLSGLTNLRRIDVSENRVSSLSPLSGLTNLTYVNLHENEISSLSALSGLTNTKTLILRFNKIGSLSALSGLANLETLDLGNNQVSSLSALSGLTQLSDLDLWGNEITSVSALSGLTNLRTLDIDRNEISSVSGLSGLDNLETLDLQSNQVSDVSPLGGLMSLRTLDLGSNEVRNISALRNLPSLKTLDLKGNYGLSREAYCSHLQEIASGGVSVTYSPNTDPPTGIRASDDAYPDKVSITWDRVCSGPAYTSYYRVFRALSASDARVAISEWQTARSFDDTTAEPGTTYYYWVRTAVSSQGQSAGDYSDREEGMRQGGYTLLISSTAGGSVTTPGEGAEAYEATTVVNVQASPIDPDLYIFAGWTGTAVDAGKVADSSAARTTVAVEGAYTLKANFVTVLETLYVDDDVSGDPQENGTPEYPFDTIQEAIEVSVDGTSIVACPGTYYENVDFQGKNVDLVGAGEVGAGGSTFPVIDGADAGVVLSFTHGESANCMVMGFVLTRGRGPLSGAILCDGSSPTLANCLIVGNRATDRNGAAIHCSDSRAVFVNCTIADNGGNAQSAAIRVADGDVTITNSILWNNGTNEILASEADDLAITYSDVAGGWFGLRNRDTDPLFAGGGYWADPADPNVVLDSADDEAIWIAGDYHLKSQAGRWDLQTQEWVADEETSPCIDAGNPLEVVGQEPDPNGDIVNLGAYGGTTEASKTY